MGAGDFCLRCMQEEVKEVLLSFLRTSTTLATSMVVASFDLRVKTLLDGKAIPPSSRLTSSPSSKRRRFPVLHSKQVGELSLLKFPPFRDLGPV